jgi:hypothetical protein
MGGLVIDIFIEFLIRVIIRFFKARGSTSWRIAKAKVTSTNCRPGGFGCAVADVTYKYRLDGELYTGDDAVPFLFTDSAKKYVTDHPSSSDLLVRIKPGSPDQSIVRQDDVYRQAHGYRLETR